MSRIYVFVIIFFTGILVFSCSRKHHPGRTSKEGTENNTVSVTKKDTAAKKIVARPTKKDLIPKVIVVNDNVAHKSIDGRYYYDLLGHRYWRNNKDGKYYLFNKSMYNDDAFKSPGK